MTESDRAAALRAVQAAMQKKWSYAESQIASTRDPLAARVYYWMYYTEQDGPFVFSRVSSFARQVQDWPRHGRLRLAVERSIRDDAPADDVIAWFNDFPPQTVDAMNRYLKALQSRNLTQKMAEVLNGWWGDATLTAAQQDQIMRDYGRMIGTDAHKRRFNITLHRDQQAQARAIARVLGKGYPELAEARIALASGSAGVDAAVSRVPPYLANDPGLAYERLRWRRQKNMDFRAIEILHNAPPANQIANPADWWRERHILTRRLMERKQFQSAYLLVKDHGMVEGVPFAEAEFLAGFLALRFLKKPAPAFEHFERLYNNSSTPITRSRAAFWAGMASAAMGAPKVAQQWYEAGAQYPTVFYGQLSLAKLGRDGEKVTGTPSLPAPVRLAFERDDRIQIARLMRQAGNRAHASAFLRAYTDSADSAEQFHLAAALATEWDQLNDTVAVARSAQRKGIVMADHVFPTMLNHVKGVNGEWALIHAIIRQESAFDQRAVSSAGARGLMQLMPATARETASKMGLRHNPDWLVDRPDHNIALGNHYIKQMISRFNGNYPMALAAYNAGPGRVNQWVQMFGDPRSDDVDMLDWLELIPVAETRNYVQRVLEGVFIYRQKFATLQKADAPIHVALVKR